ncbi:hypothetical protein Q8F55_001596 [Vanrija albida]|uniref:Uncharacterized protein n=1 Tax=Vanrija albida TaxID=181172 RepID=A0ABR3QH47_9TREE
MSATPPSTTSADAAAEWARFQAYRAHDPVYGRPERTHELETPNMKIRHLEACNAEHLPHILLRVEGMQRVLPRGLPPRAEVMTIPGFLYTHPDFECRYAKIARWPTMLAFRLCGSTLLAIQCLFCQWRGGRGFDGVCPILAKKSVTVAGPIDLAKLQQLHLIDIPGTAGSVMADNGLLASGGSADIPEVSVSGSGSGPSAAPTSNALPSTLRPPLSPASRPGPVSPTGVTPSGSNETGRRVLPPRRKPPPLRIKPAPAARPPPPAAPPPLVGSTQTSAGPSMPLNPKRGRTDAAISPEASSKRRRTAPAVAARIDQLESELANLRYLAGAKASVISNLTRRMEEQEARTTAHHDASEKVLKAAASILSLPDSPAGTAALEERLAAERQATAATIVAERKETEAVMTKDMKRMETTLGAKSNIKVQELEARLKEEHAEQLNNLETRLKDYQVELNKLDVRIRDYHAAWFDGVEARFKQQLDDAVRDVETRLVAQHATELQNLEARLKDEHAASLAAQQADHDAKIEKIEARLEEKLAQQGVAAEARVKAIASQAMADLKAVENRQASHFQKLDTKHAADLRAAEERLTAAWTTSIQEARKSITDEYEGDILAMAIHLESEWEPKLGDAAVLGVASELRAKIDQKCKSQLKKVEAKVDAGMTSRGEEMAAKMTAEMTRRGDDITAKIDTEMKSRADEFRAWQVLFTQQHGGNLSNTQLRVKDLISSNAEIRESVVRLGHDVEALQRAAGAPRAADTVDNASLVPRSFQTEGNCDEFSRRRQEALGLVSSTRQPPASSSHSGRSSIGDRSV